MKTEHNIEKFREQLLNWYDENRRILPWREDATPYRVWVSEIMLQQTRVEAVKPYFERFVKELPTLQDLSVASDDTLFKLWEGLGYYNRVMNMKKCAIKCVEKYGGNLPSTYEELIQLPGIGAYTAGAIASIAYKQKVPAVDGNVLRVFSRVLISEDDILKESTKRKFQKIIMDYLPEDRSDAFNQALMEIGALICVPNAAPRCNICPVASECMGYQSGDAHRLPNKTMKKARKIEKKTVLVITYQNQVHLCQREEKGLLAGLYEFDVYEGYLTKKQIKDLFKDNLKHMTTLEDAKHVFSHVEWHMKGYIIEVEDKTIDGIWCTKKDIKDTYAIPTAYKVYKKAWLEW